MGVIKSDKTVSASRDAIVLDLGDLGRQAQKIREAAEAEARRIVSAAQQQADDLAKAAHDQAAAEGKAAGYKEGIEQGRQSGHAEALALHDDSLAKLEQTWSDALSRWEAGRSEVEKQASESILEIALMTAEKLVHRMVEVDRQIVVDQIAGVLANVLRPTAATVHIHPDDRAAAEAALPKLMQDFAHLPRISLVEDASVDRGGCIVTHGQGRIDATIEKQLDRVIEAMAPERGRRDGSGGDADEAAEAAAALTEAEAMLAEVDGETTVGGEASQNAEADEEQVETTAASATSDASDSDASDSHASRQAVSARRGDAA